MDTPSRQRLRPWLEKKIDSDTIPGLYWLDRSQQIFRVPWKHGGKHDWQEEDSRIFKEWAVHTGRYRDGVEKPDWPIWKTRFRCALNKLPDITEVKEMSSLDGDRPFRAYKFIPRKDSKQNGSSKAPQFLQPEIDQAAQIPMPQNDEKLLHDIDFDMFMNNDDTAMETSNYDPSVLQNGHFSQFNPNEVANPTTKMEEAPVSPPMGALVPSSMATLEPRQTEPEGHEMDIKLMYHHLDVGQFTSTNVNGCRLYYGQDVEVASPLQQTVFGPGGVGNFCFPPCYELLKNQKQIDLTNKLLTALDRGLIIQCRNGDITATRKCKCAIFVSSPSLNDGTPTKLRRDEEVLIYSYSKYFYPMLQRYLMNELDEKPSIDILFGFGQNWTLSDQPLNNLLIAAVVNSSKARHDLSQISFSSPISLPLEVSKSDEIDNFYKIVKVVDSARTSMGTEWT